MLCTGSLAVALSDTEITVLSGQGQHLMHGRNRVAEQFGYIVTHRPLGEANETLGDPSQLALFKR